MTTGREQALRSFAARLGHSFSDLALLERALTHASHANETAEPGSRDNEALEFLGDAVLGLVVADLLHRLDPEGDEGTKSRARAVLVSEPSLARRAESRGIPELLRLGRGEERTGGRQKAALWADAYEAVIAALYLDSGLEAARRLVEADFQDDMTRASELGRADHKSALQEKLQARGEPVPEYVVVVETGPSHRPRFQVECRVGGVAVASAEGASKKEAQQEAARMALARL